MFFHPITPRSIFSTAQSSLPNASVNIINHSSCDGFETIRGQEKNSPHMSKCGTLEFSFREKAMRQKGGFASRRSGEILVNMSVLSDNLTASKDTNVSVTQTVNWLKLQLWKQHRHVAVARLKTSRLQRHLSHTICKSWVQLVATPQGLSFSFFFFLPVGKRLNAQCYSSASPHFRKQWLTLATLMKE